jgi:C-3',4' desaturase CrtD
VNQPDFEFVKIGMENRRQHFDVIVAGSGMGGMTSAVLMAEAGFSVLVLEKSHVPGGCSSSYYRKGYIFESGATTLIGFDENQPLKWLENKLNLSLPKKAISPSMKVHMNGKEITRWQDREQWIEEAIKHFGEPAEQKEFWNKAFAVSDVVWKVSGKNPFFPPVELKDWVQLLKNDISDVWILPYSVQSVKETATKVGITNPDFFQFLDEQLMISAQSASTETPFLFGAPAITYTNYTNYYVPGGLLEMVGMLEKFLVQKNGELHTKEGVSHIEKSENGYKVQSSKGTVYSAPVVISNLPVWNMEDYTSGDMAAYFKKESEQFDEAWGAFTMGVVTDDVYPEDMPIHHQVHLEKSDRQNGLDSGSVFVSFSAKDDTERAEEGSRVLNISTHTVPEYWFGLNGSYEQVKESVQEKILAILKKKLPYFSDAEIKMVFSSTPVSWSNWVYRKKGRVGGIPQSMTRSLIDWTPNKTPFDGLFLCGDTVYPGQGIPGVTLSGINASERAKKFLNNYINH